MAKRRKGCRRKKKSTKRGRGLSSTLFQIALRKKIDSLKSKIKRKSGRGGSLAKVKIGMLGALKPKNDGGHWHPSQPWNGGKPKLPANLPINSIKLFQK